MTIKPVFIAAAAVFGATTAFADGPTPPPVDPPVIVVPDPAHDWSGFYLGAFAGGATGDYRLESASGVGPSVDVDGAIIGLSAGYNIQNGSWVYGGVFDISTGPEGITSQGTTGPFWSCNTGDCNVTINSVATLRGRVGYAMNDSLVYASAGVAWADVDGGIFNSAQQGGGSATGWAAGLGFEQALNDQTSLNFEVLHIDVGDIPFGTGIGTEDFVGNGAFTTARIGVNFRF